MKKMLSGNFEKAAVEFEAIVKDPPPGIGISSRAAQYLAACREHLGRKTFKPKTADDYYNQGVVQMNQGDLAVALESFEQASKKAPKDDRILYCRAAAYAQSGDAEAALDALRLAVEANDSNRVFAKNDSDFTSLRVHEAFQELVSPEPSDEEE